MDDTSDEPRDLALVANSDRMSRYTALLMIVYLEEETTQLGMLDAAHLLGVAALAVQDHIAMTEIRPTAGYVPRLIS